MMTGERDWQAVGEALERRMSERTLSRADLERESLVSDTTIRSVLNGNPARLKTLSQLSRAVDWPHDALHRISLGLAPVENNGPATRTTDIGRVRSELEAMRRHLDDLLRTLDGRG
jgi:hypothetical protein